MSRDTQRPSRSAREPRRPEVHRPAAVPDDSVTSVFTVRPDLAGLRLDLWLREELPRLTRTRASAICDDLAYTADGRRLRPSHRVRSGEVVAIYRPAWEEPAAPRDLPIVYEDQDLLAVDKPAGLPVHPTARYYRNTVTSILAERFPGERIVLAHRIDRDTSGVLLAARTSEAERSLKAAFADRRVRKTYLAIVHGSPHEDRFTVDAPLCLEGGAVSVRMCVRSESEGGAASVTRFEVLSRGEGFALIAAHPETGRQHQIRVHLAHAGFALVGDKLYAHGDEVFLRCLDAPPDDELRAELLLDRHALHAAAVEFAHPRSGSTLRIEAAMAPDMESFCLVRRMALARRATGDGDTHGGP